MAPPVLGLDTYSKSDSRPQTVRPSASGRSRPTTLHRGLTGPWVAELQRKLVAKGYLSLKAMATGPGVFGPRTEQAVKGLQVDAGLPETGPTAPGAPQLVLRDTGGDPERAVHAVEELVSLHRAIAIIGPIDGQ